VHLRDQAAAAGVDNDFVVCDLGASRLLSTIADRVRAGLVVIGSSTSFLHKVAGLTLARRLTRSRHWPVTIVP
jgi:hypothetical protein